MSDRQMFTAGVIPAMSATANKIAAAAVCALMDDLGSPGVDRKVNWSIAYHIAMIQSEDAEHTALLDLMVKAREYRLRGLLDDSVAALVSDYITSRDSLQR
jgi:hypothetical protein